MLSCIVISLLRDSADFRTAKINGSAGALAFTYSRSYPSSDVANQCVCQRHMNGDIQEMEQRSRSYRISVDRENSRDETAQKICCYGLSETKWISSTQSPIVLVCSRRELGLVRALSVARRGCWLHWNVSKNTSCLFHFIASNIIMFQHII